MPADKKPVQVTEDKHFVDYEGTKIELPKPISEMTEGDWVRLASFAGSSLNRVEVSNQSFLGLHVTLKDKNYIPMWLYCAGRDADIPRAFDTLERAINMGAELISTLDDIDLAGSSLRLSADGHIHKDDVVLAKVPIVAYYALQAQNIRRSRSSIEYKSVENKAYEGIDMPHYVRGNKDIPVYEATEHSVQYQDRPRF
ncbi:MAG: hypothetical protein ACYCOU_03655 [Sulfobacillus sp.]